MELQRTVRAAVEARAVDHIGDLAYHDQVVHLRPVLRIIFEVGVLDDEHVAGRGRERSLQTSAFALVALVIERADRHGRAGWRLRKREAAARP